MHWLWTFITWFWDRGWEEYIGYGILFITSTRVQILPLCLSVYHVTFPFKKFRHLKMVREFDIILSFDAKMNDLSMVIGWLLFLNSIFVHTCDLLISRACGGGILRSDLFFSSETCKIEYG